MYAPIVPATLTLRPADSPSFAVCAPRSCTAAAASPCAGQIAPPGLLEKPGDQPLLVRCWCLAAAAKLPRPGCWRNRATSRCWCAAGAWLPLRPSCCAAPLPSRRCNGFPPRPPPPAELRSLAGEDRDDVVVDVLLRDLVPVGHLELHRQALRAATKGVSAFHIATSAAQNVVCLKSLRGHQQNSRCWNVERTSR